MRIGCVSTMDIGSSISYRRFLNDYYHDFRIRHFNDIIDFLEQDEDNTFDQYLLEHEILDEVKTMFVYNATAITNELGMNHLGSIVDEKDSNIEAKVYFDVVKMIKVKLKDVILDSSAYYDFANRIN